MQRRIEETHIKYDTRLLVRARKMRRKPTPAEATFWDEIASKRPFGFKFTRQKPLGEFIVDFYCSKLMLAIEIDGFIHDQNIESDIERSIKLRKSGIRVIRYKNSEVLNNIKQVKQNLCSIIITFKEEYNEALASTKSPDKGI